MSSGPSVSASASPAPRIELLVLQPTPFCNIDCDYCYLPNRSSRARMSPELLRQTFEKVFASGWVGEELTVVWHAGEPLVLPVSFYESAFASAEALRPEGTVVHHAFQTNGTRIDDGWCELFRRACVRVGVSLDGPAFLHDAHRRTRRGGGTHAQVMEGIRCLARNGLDFHVITVLTLASLDQAEALHEFYLANEIPRVGFNVEEIEGAHGKSTLDAAGIENKFRAFLDRFLTLTERRGGPAVREIEQLDRFVRARTPWLTGNQENQPTSIVTVDVSGNVSTFSPELAGAPSSDYDDFRLGNIQTDELDDMLRQEVFWRLKGAIDRGVQRCAESCTFFALCGGGSPSNKFFETGSFDATETLHCRLTKKTLADVYLTRLENDVLAGRSSRAV